MLLQADFKYDHTFNPLFPILTTYTEQSTCVVLAILLPHRQLGTQFYINNPVDHWFWWWHRGNTRNFDIKHNSFLRQTSTHTTVTGVSLCHCWQVDRFVVISPTWMAKMQLVYGVKSCYRFSVLVYIIGCHAARNIIMYDLFFMYETCLHMHVISHLCYTSIKRNM